MANKAQKKQQTKNAEAQDHLGTLQYGHIKLATQIIDVASQRGAFRANELRDVGEVYNELSKFVQSVEERAQQEEADNEETGEKE